MVTSLINNVIGDTDIYLIDQILKGRYKEHETILDAGCGIGRNMHWFLQNQLCIYGIDSNANYITELKMDYADLPPIRLQVADIEQMPFGDNFCLKFLPNYLQYSTVWNLFKIIRIFGNCQNFDG